MKILCLLSWPPGGRWIWEYLPDQGDQVDFLYIKPPADRFPGYGKLLNYYPKFWGLGMKAFPVSRKYDVIITWEANTAIPLAFFRSLSGLRTPPLLVLNFVLKGRPIFDFIGVIRFAAHSISHITCLSSAEALTYAQLLDIPGENCHVLQGPFRDFFEDNQDQIYPGDTIFSAGRSNRDYATLMAAVRGLPVQVLINARQFNVKGLQPPVNVSINPFLPYYEYLALLQGAKFVIIPLFNQGRASGETFMVQAMTARKAVIASRTPSTAEMIEHGVTGLLVQAGDHLELRNAILHLSNHPDDAERLGKAARQEYLERWSFPVVSRQINSLVHEIV